MSEGSREAQAGDKAPGTDRGRQSLFAPSYYSNIGILGFIAGPQERQHLQCSEKQNSSRPLLYKHDFEYGSNSNKTLLDKLRAQAGFTEHTQKRRLFSACNS